MSGFARGANRVTLPGDTYQCKQFTPNGSTAVIARHKERGLIGRLSISDSLDANLPVITKNPEDAERVKLNMVRIDGDSELKLTMKAAGKITGRVVDKDGKPRVVRIDGYERLIKTDDDGRFELPLVLPEFPITATAIHREQGQFLGTIFSDIILEPGETRDLGDVQVTRNVQ